MSATAFLDGIQLADVDVATPTLDAVHARAPIDSADCRLTAWRDACNSSTGADNLVRVGGIAYAIDLQPRRQKNGALIGRVYSKAAGEAFRDIGMYKIGSSGQVIEIPVAELAGALPGAASATEHERS